MAYETFDLNFVIKKGIMRSCIPHIHILGVTPFSMYFESIMNMCRWKA